MSHRVVKFITALFCAAWVAVASPLCAQAMPQQGESFATPTWRDLVETFVLSQGIDINNPKVADDYAKLAYCSIYKKKYTDDFEWNKIRSQIINRVNQKRDYFRVQYQLEGTLYLGRYDFQTQQFPFIKDSAMVHVGSFLALGGEDVTKFAYRLCSDKDLSKFFPTNYLFVINMPLTFKGLKVSQDQAQVLLDKMAAMGNSDRRIYARFRYRVQTVEKKILTPQNISTFDAKNGPGVFHGELVSLDLFLDRAMTKFYMNIPVK